MRDGQLLFTWRKISTGAEPRRCDPVTRHLSKHLSQSASRQRSEACGFILLTTGGSFVLLWCHKS
ncbi:hypothetical protein E2C01_053893 [Portunus trituberculatus]|uniref:Uncharacterized protein n=1 Tax=Portunus trituberculatus TaxID=210409 RepID=A0A5B7GRA1_PORTR|nr:hypothetical protein [Portunus trituberculatus]